MVNISLDTISASGNTTLLSQKNRGGPISIPYVVDYRTELVLYVFDKEETCQPSGVGH